ncbi:probable protein phosphatase 2C 80 [Impatiens glandulifera]|uniref:probable protein phosphatase 2C 80 n=1 Tax=Impatiens glandulifera TaxID=253017 RepID=UPI001FB10426|nr:probable protein phosphatase 2C 80 [Impatiens glandulifera]XP_047312168.1 probable protein phosphatase 2C 80 [Impatiens glandulifera]
MRSVLTRVMASTGSIASAGDIVVDSLISTCGNLSNFAKPAGVYFTDGGAHHCQKAGISLRLKEGIKGHGVYRQYSFAAAQKPCNSSSFVGRRSNWFRTSSTASYADGAEADVTFDELKIGKQLVNSAMSSDLNVVVEKRLRLVSGSCYLPHPEKVKTGGEDAHFICEEEQTIGVADGVGGWADVGVNAGYYARELMSNSIAAIRDEPKGSVDPARVLEKAHSLTKAKGSSTACIITLTTEGLLAINLGDSGFIVVRDGISIFRSPVQQHGFNFTYQLESGTGSDLPSSGQVFTVPVSVGDIIVAGSDGLFDNLYNEEITEVIVDAVKAGLDPQGMAQKIAALARKRALDRNRQSPFSVAAQEAGFRYYGGKLDDTTVLVSYVTSGCSSKL